MAEVTWFKVLTDIFSDDKIKIIQSMPEGDSLLVMWFKVLSQAGKTNDGGYIYLKKNIPYTAGMLATLFNKPQQLVEMALRTFTEFGMIDIDDKGYIFVTNFEKHQSIEGMDRVREKTKLRVQAHREKKRMELLECNVTSNATVTVGNAIEVEVDLDKENTTTTDFEIAFSRVNKIYGAIHGKLDIEPMHLPLLTKLLNEGVSADLIIQTMQEKHAEKVKAGGRVSSFNYYEDAIMERHAGVKTKVTQISTKYQSRREEIKPAAEPLSADEIAAIGEW